MIPYVCGSISMVVWGWISDRMGERRWNLFLGCIVAASGLVLAGRYIGSYWSLVGMSIAAIGFYGTNQPRASPLISLALERDERPSRRARGYGSSIAGSILLLISQPGAGHELLLRAPQAQYTMALSLF
jgi:MFS family permease